MGRRFYWNVHANQGAVGPIMRRAGEAPAARITYDHAATVIDLAIDETHLYWGDGAGSILKMPK